jgi:hypothetical protein
MTTPLYKLLGERLDALAGRIVEVAKSDHGEHKILRTGTRLAKTGHLLIDRYVNTEVDPLIPPLGSPTYVDVEAKWRFILCLLAHGTARGDRLISTKSSLGRAMQQAGLKDTRVNRLLDDYPTFYDETLTSLVKLFADRGVWFDITPIAYGMLYPDASDIEEIRANIGRDFWILRKNQRSAPTPTEEASALQKSTLAVPPPAE